MRILLLSASLSIALCGLAHASGTFIPMPVADVQITKITVNGAYAVGAITETAAYRWTADTGVGELFPSMNTALGINNTGTMSGSVTENGGVQNGGRDLGAYTPIGAAPVLLTSTLQTNSTGYDIADNGTVVGLSFNDGFVGAAVAYAWTAAEGMIALPVNRPENYSRANAISADGNTIVGWNDGDSGRSAVIWRNRVQLDVVDANGISVGEASAVSVNGEFVVGGYYTNAANETGAWRWSAANGVQLIPGMPFAFGVSSDGKTVVGATGFFDFPPRTPMVWREGVGTVTLVDYMTENGISLPAGWDLGGGLTALSGNARLLGGWGFGPLGLQSYIVRIDAPDSIFADGFEPEAP